VRFIFLSTAILWPSCSATRFRFAEQNDHKCPLDDDTQINQLNRPAFGKSPLGDISRFGYDHWPLLTVMQRIGPIRRWNPC